MISGHPLGPGVPLGVIDTFFIKPVEHALQLMLFLCHE